MHLKVSAVRIDGSCQETTFDGYAAEICAIKYYRELKDNKHMKFVQMSERHMNRFGGDISWDIRQSDVLHPVAVVV